MVDRLVLVTGATGYIGTALVPLLAKHYHVRTLDTETFGNAIAGTSNVEFQRGDIRNPMAVTRALDGVTDIIHLAGIVTDDLVDLNLDFGRQVNEDALEMLCRMAADRGVGRLVYASSSSVYGSQPMGTDGSPVPATEVTQPLPMTEYARTKLRGEEIVRKYQDRMTVVAIRSATACGPAPRMRADTIVNTFSGQAYFHREITVHGGVQWRSNIHVADVAALYKFLLGISADAINGQIFNATRSNHTALGLAEMVLDVIPCKLTIQPDKADPRNYSMAANKLLGVLGWRPLHTIHDAIRDNLHWFEAGHLKDWDDPIYWNTRRMRDIVLEG